MNEFLVLSLIVSTFALNAFCMLPSSWKPPAPQEVVFGECFFVPEITGVDQSDEIYYTFRHICRQECPQGGPQPPQHEIYWYLVGSLTSTRTPSPMPQHNYVPIRQWLMKFTFLKELEVKFLVRTTTREIKITFQSVQQRQAFYTMVYQDVNLTKASTIIIGLLHEILIHEDRSIGGDRQISNNIEALYEGVNFLWYITLKNARGEPVLIFSQNDASISRMRSATYNKRQLLLKAHGTFYILTFRSHGEAKQFSDALLPYVSVLAISDIDFSIEAYFKYRNEIAIL